MGNGSQPPSSPVSATGASMDGYLTNNVIGNDIVGQALIDLDLGFFAAPATSAQENSNQQGIDTEAFNGFLNESSFTASTSIPTINSNSYIGGHDTCHYILQATDETINNISPASQMVSPENCCQTLNAPDTGTMPDNSPRKRRHSSSDSNGSDVSTSPKKSKTTLWRPQQKADLNENESK